VYHFRVGGESKPMNVEPNTDKAMPLDALRSHHLLQTMPWQSRRRAFPAAR